MRALFFASMLILSACSTAPAPPVETAEAAYDGDTLIDDVRILADDAMQGRAPDTKGSRMARSYIEYRFEEIGVEPIGESFEQPFIFTTKGAAHNGVNVIGRIAGTSRSKTVMVVTAHYDHLGIINGQIFNGADDNASGVATLLAVARALVDDPPRHDVILAAVDAEEGGSRGARVLVSDPPVPLGRIALNVNLDMLSKSDRGELYAAGAAHWPFMRGRLESLAAQAPVTLKLGHDSPGWGEGQDWTMESDHAAFHEKGIPWVYFGVEDHAEYHQPTDRFNTIPQDFFHRSAQTVVEAVRAFDQDLDAIAKDAGR
ncbi:MAG TPA: M20/M25/M40 family metallo-hydrolase [Caulobacteraceae bacterium]